MRKLLTAVALLLEHLLAAWIEWERQQEERKRQAEIERLRNDSVEWWQRNFGTADVGGRLQDAAQTQSDAAPSSARDRTG